MVVQNQPQPPTELQELMEVCTNLQRIVLTLEETKTTQATEIISLKKRVKKLEKRKMSRTYKLKRLYKGRKIDDIDVDIDVTLVNDVVNDDEMFDVDAKINVDYELAQRLQGEEQEELSDEEKAKLFVQLMEARKKHFAAKRAKEQRSKPPTKAQNRKTIATKRVNTFVDMDTEVVEGSSKRAGTEVVKE
ncbi:hypothetical protein Tco_0042268, partial [Tanacetum coccineum]